MGDRFLCLRQLGSRLSVFVAHANQGLRLSVFSSHQRTQHAGDVVGSQAWADGRTKTNVTPKNIYTLFFLVVEDFKHDEDNLT